MLKTLYLPKKVVPGDFPEVFYTKDFVNDFFMHYALLHDASAGRHMVKVGMATMLRNPLGALLAYGDEPSIVLTAPLQAKEVCGNKVDFLVDITARTLTEAIGLPFASEQVDGKVIFQQADGMLYVVRMCFVDYVQTHHVYDVLPKAEFVPLKAVPGLPLEPKSRSLISGLLGSVPA
jgi:hypothetical protein